MLVNVDGEAFMHPLETRDVSAAAEAGNQDAINCLEAYAYRIIKYIGSYIAAMGGVDVITFTAGLGENAIPLRETICKAFEVHGSGIRF